MTFGKNIHYGKWRPVALRWGSPGSAISAFTFSSLIMKAVLEDTSMYTVSRKSLRHSSLTLTIKLARVDIIS